MKRIIFVNQDTGPLLIDIINVFVKNKCEVILYTGKVTKTYIDLNKKVKIRKLCPYKRNNMFNRLFTWFIFFIQSLFLLFFDLNSKTRMFLITNPPFITFLPFIFKNKFDIHVYDVYPDALLTLPYITKASLIYKFYSYLNKKVYKKAENIFTPSEGMRSMLIKYVNKDKIKLHQWWANTDFIKPINKEKNKFISKYNLKNKFIIMYSGNLGLTHNIETILDVAFLLKDNNKIMFIIIGDGPKKKVVNDFLLKFNLKNLLILPFQDENMLPHSLTASDISIVTLDKNVSMASIPSKTYYILSAGSAILAIADKKSELNKLINIHNIGMTQSSDNIQEIIEFINSCYDNDKILNNFKKNSRQASKNYTMKNAEIFFDIIIKN